MNRELEKIPGVIWNFSQPISDNVEEAVSGVKGALAVKIYGDNLKILEEKADQITDIMKDIPGVEDLGVFRVRGQPNLNFTVDRAAAARYGINVSDVQDAIQTAVGGNALTQVLQGEQRYDLVLRYLPTYRDTKEAIEKIRLLAPSNERVSLAQLTKVNVEDGGSEIYREANSRYIAVKYSVRGRDLGSTVEEAMKKVGQQVKLPVGYTIDWAGEYESQKRSERRLLLVLPVTIWVIFVILYFMFDSVKWALLILTNVAMARIGGLVALLITGTNFSVSSGVGFLALFGVSVQTGVIMLEYINQLRARGGSIVEAAVDGALFGVFINQGEVCSAGSRILVQRPIYKKFVEVMAEKAKTIRLGPPLERETKMGPLVSQEQYDRVRSYLEVGRKEAKLAAGGDRPASFAKGYYISPTIFYDVDNSARIAREEIFGPVASVIPFDDEADAIRIANDSPYGLAAAVWTRDIFKAFRAVKKIRAGIVWVNHMQPTYVEAPWGGFKQSGFGRELGPWGLEEYLETKLVHVNLNESPIGWY